MIADEHASLTGSGTTGISLMTAWHLRADTDLVVNIKMGSSGTIIIPLAALAGKVIGCTYEHPLNSINSDWYVEFVSGTGRVTMSGR